MAKPQILTDQELDFLTHPFQKSEYSKDRALELASAGCIAMITEPGDRMAGALARSLGKLALVELLIDGLETRSVVQALQQRGQLDSCRQSFGDLEGTLADSRQRWLPRLSKSRLEHLFFQSAALKLKLVTAEDANWPAGLDDLQDSAPSILFVEGDPETLTKLSQAVSIVGSRLASSYGLQVTSFLVRELAQVARPTVSGGALGIDAQVHLSSIEQKLPSVAVMAGGMDRKYPSANFKLFKQVTDHGLLLSEMPPGVAPTRWRFLQRNRLIAALTPTTVVIEAGIRSGSIRTANNALELSRELYAVPGSVLSGTSLGTNALIADSKAQILCDLKYFATGSLRIPNQQIESALAKRAQDAIRESGFPSLPEVAKLAGLTFSESELALRELTAQDKVIENRSSKGEVHYALKYAF
ncbi:Smf Predicted Rossmann fold nucleotide-binding protein involved in DNA uptake [Microbacteriaceae bacterium]